MNPTGHAAVATYVKRPASRMAAGNGAQIESLARAYERPALRKPFAAFPADTKVA